MKYRSMLFIPANKEKFYKNESKNSSDAFIIDFEDSVRENDLDNNLKIFKENIKFIEKDFYIRINNNYYKKIIEETINFNISGYMIPKVENKNFINEIFVFLKKIDCSESKKMILLIESPMGVLNLKDILVENNRNIFAVAFGSEDYLSNLGVLVRNKENLFFARTNILNVSKAFEKDVYDTIFPKINNDLELVEEINYVKMLGFDGKLVIHPNQIEKVNKIFGISEEEIKGIKNIINYYEEESKKNNSNVVLYSGKIIEPPHIKRLKKLLELRRI